MEQYKTIKNTIGISSSIDIRRDEKVEILSQPDPVTYCIRYYPKGSITGPTDVMVPVSCFTD